MFIIFAHLQQGLFAPVLKRVDESKLLGPFTPTLLNLRSQKVRSYQDLALDKNTTMAEEALDILLWLPTSCSRREKLARAHNKINTCWTSVSQVIK